MNPASAKPVDTQILSDLLMEIKGICIVLNQGHKLVKKRHPVSLFLCYISFYLFQKSFGQQISSVGPVFARIIYQAGYDTLEKMANATPEEMHERLWAVNREGGYTKIMATLKETRYCIEYAQQLPKVIEY